jgi:tetrahydromethanopterin S-methyltransferase subunit G
MMGNQEQIDPNAIYDKIRKDDARDYFAEISGQSIGRIKRFLSPEALKAIEDEKSGKKDLMDLLDILLLTDPVYARLYSNVMERIEDIDQAVSRARESLHEQMALWQRREQNADDRANHLADGTRIYRDTNGDVFREDGHKLTEEEKRGIVWNETHTTWEEHNTIQNHIAALRKKLDEIDNYCDNTLNPIKQRMHERNPPPDRDDMQQFYKDMENDNMPETVKVFLREPSIDANKAAASPFQNAFRERADIGSTDNPAAPKMDIPDFGTSQATTVPPVAPIEGMPRLGG